MTSGRFPSPNSIASLTLEFIKARSNRPIERWEFKEFLESIGKEYDCNYMSGIISELRRSPRRKFPVIIALHGGRYKYLPGVSGEKRAYRRSRQDGKRKRT